MNLHTSRHRQHVSILPRMFLRVCFSLMTIVLITAGLVGVSEGFVKELPYGQVQVITAETIQLKHAIYRLHENLIVTDNAGRVRKLEEIFIGSVIVFHLTQGRVDRIIWMVDGT